MKLELRAIRVKNCGPLDDVRVEFYDEQGKTLPVCVLAGANGSGKTTILEAINWLIPSLSSTHLQGDYSFGYVQLDLLVEGSKLTIAAGKKPDDANLPPDHVFFDRSVKAGNSRNGRRQGTLIEKLSQQINQQKGSDLSEFAKSQLDVSYVPSIIYLPHTRSLEPVAGEGVKKEALPYNLVQRVDVVRSFPGSLNSYLIWLDYAEPEQFKAAQSFLNELDFEGKTFHVQRKTLDIMVHTPDGHEHKLHELSSGEQNLLIILMELRRRLLPHSIVLIDEIENSLHPAFQHKLAQALLKMQQMIPFQLIVTTHSWTFAEIFGPSATRVLTKF